MTARFILLVEDSPDDQALTIRALKKSNVCNEVIVVWDGAEALDFFFAGVSMLAVIHAIRRS